MIVVYVFFMIVLLFLLMISRCLCTEAKQKDLILKAIVACLVEQNYRKTSDISSDISQSKLREMTKHLYILLFATK